MSSALPLLLFGLAALVPAWAAETGDVGDAPPVFRELEEGMEKLMAGLEPDIPKLRALSRRYPSEEGLRAARAEREEVRSRLQSGHDALKSMGETFEEKAKAHRMMVAIGLSQLVDKAKSKRRDETLSSVTGQEVGSAWAVDAFFQRTNDFRKDIRTALIRDEEAYQSALGEFERGRRRRGRLWGFSAFALLVSAGVLVRRVQGSARRGTGV